MQAEEVPRNTACGNYWNRVLVDLGGTQYPGTTTQRCFGLHATSASEVRGPDSRLIPHRDQMGERSLESRASPYI